MDRVGLVRLGCIEALSALQSDAPDDPLLAFALTTDDDVSTLLHVGCTRSFAASSGIVDIRFLPNEWVQDGRCKPAARRARNRRAQPAERRS